MDIYTFYLFINLVSSLFCDKYNQLSATNLTHIRLNRLMSDINIHSHVFNVIKQIKYTAIYQTINTYIINFYLLF